MTPAPPNPAPDGDWIELLAAYADDELDAPTRERVERWLAAHPEAKDALRSQQKFSPDNRRLWRKLEPRMPSEDTWAVVRDAVADGVKKTAEPAPDRARPTRWKWVATGIAAATTAAAIVLSGAGTPKSPVAVPAVFHGNPAEADPHDGVAVLPVTTPDDVVFFRVPGDAAALLPVGAAQLTGKLVLATADDVRIEEAEPTATWPGKMTPGPGDSPMIYASKP